LAIFFSRKSTGETMMDSVGTSQQPAPTGDGKDVTTLVIQDLEARATAGENKYGTQDP
jgi:hypothetical protein